MIRHYEAAGLFAAARRTESGYRQYDQNKVQALRFIRPARDLGFSFLEISDLVGLWQNRRRPSRLVKQLAQAHIRDLEQKAQELSALEHLVYDCHGDNRPECPILDELAKPAPVVASARRAATKALARPRRRASV